MWLMSILPWYGLPEAVFWSMMYLRQASISVPLPEFDVSAAATMKPCLAK